MLGAIHNLRNPPSRGCVRVGPSGLLGGWGRGEDQSCPFGRQARVTTGLLKGGGAQVVNDPLL